jgi:hypothetical protein
VPCRVGDLPHEGIVEVPRLDRLRHPARHSHTHVHIQIDRGSEEYVHAYPHPNRQRVRVCTD